MKIQRYLTIIIFILPLISCDKETVKQIPLSATIISVEKYGNVKINTDTAYEKYDAQGKLTEKTFIWYTDSQRNFKKIKFGSLGNQIEEHINYQNGLIKSSSFLEHDENNAPLRHKFIEKDTVIILEYINTFNDVRQIHRSYQLHNADTTALIVYKYNDAGLKTHVDYYLNDFESPIRIERFQYDEQGSKIQHIDHDLRNDQELRTTFEYEKGLEVSWTEWENGIKILEAKKRYNVLDLPIKETIEYIDDKTTVTLTYNYKYRE